MKRLLGLLVFTMLLAGMASAATLDPFFAKVVQIEKIVSHEKGYKVTYYTAHGDLATVYVPIEWFSQGSKFKTEEGFLKGEVVAGSGPQYPYMQIFWRNGKFHHLRLFVVKDYSSRTWGVVKADEEKKLAAMFDPAKDPEFSF